MRASGCVSEWTMASVTFPDGILAQHVLVAKLIEALREAQTQHSPELAAKIDEVLDAVRQHFASEEDHMQRYGYPKLDAHRQQHETFLRRLVVLRGECQSGDPELIKMFAESLEAWFRTHERTADEEVLSFLGLRN